MSWLYSRALVAGYLEEHSSDGEPSARSNAMLTPPAFLLRDRTTEFWRRFPSGMMCEPLMGDRGQELLTSYLAGFHVKRSAAPDRDKESRGSEADCGASSLVSLARFDPATHSLKTRQTLLFEDCTESLLILPEWGWMHNGECFPLAPLVLHTCGVVCSLWPTPRADGRDNCGGSNARKKAQATGTYISRYPNPTFQERLMGWPLQWSALEPLGTDRFQRWRRLHGGF
jgi:hypothetical protein